MANPQWFHCFQYSYFIPQIPYDCGNGIGGKVKGNGGECAPRRTCENGTGPRRATSRRGGGAPQRRPVPGTCTCVKGGRGDRTRTTPWGAGALFLTRQTVLDGIYHFLAKVRSAESESPGFAGSGHPECFACHLPGNGPAPITPGSRRGQCNNQGNQLLFPVDIESWVPPRPQTGSPQQLLSPLVGTVAIACRVLLASMGWVGAVS
eukprot:gene9928-biopygen12275